MYRIADETPSPMLARDCVLTEQLTPDKLASQMPADQGTHFSHSACKCMIFEISQVNYIENGT